MKIFFKRKNPSPGIFHQSADAEEFFPGFLGTLLLFLKAMSIDAKELNSDEFRNTTSALARKLKTAKTVKEIKSLFEKKQKMMALFVKKQNWYLSNKESEYKDMIDLLTRSMAKINVENEDFSRKILQQSSKIENVTSLSDIKQIKDALRETIKEIREGVRQKRERDDRRMKLLSEKVETLSTELKKAEKGTMRDGLTGVYNMNAFKHSIREALHDSPARQTPFILLALDVDGFDKITKLYDSKIADRVLLALAERCREFLKPGDFVARYEKGLFVMLLNGETQRKATKRAKQFRKSIEQSKYALDDMSGEHVFSFTISVGISPFLKNDTPETIIRRALSALKSAKDAGGNRVVAV